MRGLPVLLLLITRLTCAQTPIDTLHWQANRRLQLTDFHGPAQRGLGGSEFHYQLGYNMQPLLLSRQPAVDAYCLMFRNLSWVSETARNDRTLDYNQVLFDLVELYTRRLKTQLVALRPDRHFREKATRLDYETNADLGREVGQFRAETGGGDEVVPLRDWQQRVARQLNETPELRTVYRQSALGYGIWGGLTGALPVGAAGQTLNAAPGLTYGLDIAYRQTMLFASMGLHRTSLRSTVNQSGHVWESGLSVRVATLDLALGHIVAESAYRRLVPFVGYRQLLITPQNRFDEQHQGYAMTYHLPVVGALLDLTFADNTRNQNRIDSRRWFIRTRVSYSPLLTDETLTGGLLMVQVGVGGFGRLRRVSYQSITTNP
jgi:hypothetical protein